MLRERHHYLQRRPEVALMPKTIPVKVTAEVSVRLANEVTHRCPPAGSGYTPCCGVAPFALPWTDRMTARADQVTCKGTPSDS